MKFKLEISKALTPHLLKNWINLTTENRKKVKLYLAYFLEYEKRDSYVNKLTKAEKRNGSVKKEDLFHISADTTILTEQLIHFSTLFQILHLFSDYSSSRVGTGTLSSSSSTYTLRGQTSEGSIGLLSLMTMFLFPLYVRAHHFDIAYQDTVDKYVTCQVCGMLLRRSIFASHLRIRHAEMFPEPNSPQIDEDSTSQWLSEEYPEINRNSSSTTSPKVYLIAFRRVKDNNNAYEPPNKRIQHFHLVLNQNSQRRACIIGEYFLFNTYLRSSPCKGSKEVNLKQAECKVSSNCLSTMKYSGNYLSSTQSGCRSITDQPLELPIFPSCNQKIMLDIQQFHIPLSVPPFCPLTKSLTSAMCSSSILELKHFTSSNNSFVFPALQNSQEVSSSNQMRYLDIRNSQSTVLSPFHYQSYSKNTGLFNSKLQILSKDACNLKTSEMLTVESSVCSRAKQTVERSIPDEPISSCVNLDFFKTDYNTPLLDNRNFPVISSLATSQQQELTDLQVRYESTSFDPRNIGTTQLHKNFNELIISPGSHKSTQWNQDTIINSVSNLFNADREKDGRETVAYLLSTPETLSSEGIPCYSITPEDATLKEEQKEKSSSHPVSVSCLQMKSHNLDGWQFFLPKGTNGEKTHEVDRFLKKLRVERLLSGLSDESIDTACERILEENKHWIIEKKNDEEMTRIVLPIEYDKIELPILRLTGKGNKVSNETSLASSNIKNKLEAFRANTETVNVGWDEIKSLENLLIGERKYEKGLEPDILVIGETNRLNKSELFKNGKSRINVENTTSIDQRRSYHLDPFLDETYTLNKNFKLENNSLSNNHKGKVSASKPKELFSTRMLMNMIRSNRIELEITQESEEENKKEQHEDQQTNMNRRDEDTGDLMDRIRNWTVEPLRRKTRPAIFSSLQDHVGNLLSSNWHKYDEIKKDCHTERTNYDKKILCNNKSENRIASMPILAHNSLQLSLEQVNKISPKYIADFQKTLDVFEEQSVESITCSFSFERIPIEESASISYTNYLKGNKGCQT
uniref:C2H2-type domain-containing protein n=1 Tax=Heterorhabditis bacteriophora TaxID=37862 RepID=A0A1I7X7P8_HETBA